MRCSIVLAIALAFCASVWSAATYDVAQAQFSSQGVRPARPPRRPFSAGFAVNAINAEMSQSRRFSQSSIGSGGHSVGGGSGVSYEGASRAFNIGAALFAACSGDAAWETNPAGVFVCMEQNVPAQCGGDESCMRDSYLVIAHEFQVLAD